MKKINELFKPVNLTKGSVWKVIAGFSVITSKHSGQKHRRDKAFAGNADCFIFHYRRYPYGGFDSFD